MKALTLLAVVLTFGLATISINDAEAARLAAADEKGEDEKQRVAAQKAKTEKGEAEKAGAK